jgi:hypothetical protein
MYTLCVRIDVATEENCEKSQYGYLYFLLGYGIVWFVDRVLTFKRNVFPLFSSPRRRR